MGDTRDSVKTIFGKALEFCSDDDRAKYLDEACSGNESLRAEVDDLLKAIDRAGEFLGGSSPNTPTIVPALTESPGHTIGPYKLLQQIGEGGMGVVYMAEQTEPVERRVALKIIKPGMDSRQVIARFEAERQALAMMDHPNIAKVLDAGTTNSGRPYFVMELVKGMPITQYCDEQHLTPEERLELFLPICQAVQHAHQKGVIHRDLKPSNILVARYDDRAVPKVIDFGVAKAVSQRLTEKTMFTQYGQIVGTIEYMAPEQARFNQLDVDTRSDIYSLGVLLYELLTGNTPFDKQRLRSAAFEELLRIIREEEPPKPSVKLSTCATLPSIAASRHIEPHKLSTLVRGELDWIVMKALEKDRTRRYETASAFAADVQHYLNDEAVVACPPSAGYRFRKFARRNKVAIGTTAIVATSLIAGIIGTTWQAVHARQERDRAIRAEARSVAAEQEAIEESRRAKLAEARAVAETERAEQEAKRAATEAAIAKAVNDFLDKDLLARADPLMEPDRNMTLRTVLDRAAARIEKRFANQPLVEAAIRGTLGWTYVRLGEFQTAEELLRPSLEISQGELGSEHPRTLLAMARLAGAISSQGRHAEAEPLLRFVYETRERQLGPDDPATLVGKMQLALSVGGLGGHDEAEKMLREVLEIERRDLGPEKFSTLTTWMNLAHEINRQERHEEAEKNYHEILQIQQRVLRPEHPWTLTCMTSLGLSIAEQGRYAEAERLFHEALEIMERVLGADHPRTALTRDFLKVTYNRWLRELAAAADRDLDRETEIVQRLIDMYPAPKNRSVADWGHLGQDLYRAGRFEQAREALQTVIKLRGDEGPTMEYGPRWWYYAMTLCQLNESDRAREIYDQLVVLLKQSPPADVDTYNRLRTDAADLLGIDAGPAENE